MTKLMFVNEGSSQESYTNNLKFNITGFKKKKQLAWGNQLAIYKRGQGFEVEISLLNKSS